MSLCRKIFALSVVAFLFCLHSETLAAPVVAKIIDGNRVPSSNFPNVTPIIIDSENLCTGTLVSRDTVLTAAHCFFNDRNRRAVGDKDVQLNFAGQVFQSSKVFINPTYSSRSEACVENEYDAALIKFENPELMPASVIPANLYRSTPVRGQKLTLVGYGLEGDGRSGQLDSMPPAGQVNFGYTNIERVFDTYLQWNFDSGESNTAGGDSGGPSFADIAGTATLLGITCGGTGNAQFGTESYNTRVDRIAAWIDSVAGSSAIPVAPQYVGSQFIQANTQQPFSIELLFGGSTPDSVQVIGLPEGLSFNERIISGTPLAAGQYILTVIASNTNGSSASQLTLSVASFSPNLVIRSILLQFDDLKSSSDFMIVKGNINLPSRFKPRGKNARIQIGRYKKSCKLDAKAGCGGFDFLQFNGAIKRNEFKNSRVGFTLQLVNSKLFKALASLGFPETDYATAGEIISLPVEMELNGVTYNTTVSMRFRVSDLRWILSRT